MCAGHLSATMRLFATVAILVAVGVEADGGAFKPWSCIGESELFTKGSRTYEDKDNNDDQGSSDMPTGTTTFAFFLTDGTPGSKHAYGKASLTTDYQTIPQAISVLSKDAWPVSTLPPSTTTTTNHECAPGH